MKPQRILLADDDPKLLSLLKSSLQKEGYATIEVFDGEAALEQIKSEKPDLVLADIAMPKVDGFELCQIIRNDPALAYIPFIFLTAKGELHDRVKGLNFGADDYISKPFHISEVVARIKVVIQRSAPPSAVAEDNETDLRGNLEQMGMPEVVQTLSMAKKTGCLKIINQSKVGRLYFQGGDVVHATLDKYKNEEAAYRLLAWAEGYFEFDSKDRVERSTLTSTTTSLLMEGFSQRDEYVKYKEAMPPFDAILKLKDPVQKAEMKPTTQKIADLIDGQRTIQGIIDASPVNYVVTTKLLYTLLKKGSLEVIEAPKTADQDDEDYTQLAHELYD
jgi:CheY-like chemotaxis protein